MCRLGEDDFFLVCRLFALAEVGAVRTPWDLAVRAGLAVQEAERVCELAHAEGFICYVTGEEAVR